MTTLKALIVQFLFDCMLITRIQGNSDLYVCITAACIHAIIHRTTYTRFTARRKNSNVPVVAADPT